MFSTTKAIILSSSEHINYYHRFLITLNKHMAYIRSRVIHSIIFNIICFFVLLSNRGNAPYVYSQSHHNTVYVHHLLYTSYIAQCLCYNFIRGDCYGSFAVYSKETDDERSSVAVRCSDDKVNVKLPCILVRSKRKCRRWSDQHNLNWCCKRICVWTQTSTKK